MLPGRDSRRRRRPAPPALVEQNADAVESNCDRHKKLVQKKNSKLEKDLLSSSSFSLSPPSERQHRHRLRRPVVDDDPGGRDELPRGELDGLLRREPPEDGRDGVQPRSAARRGRGRRAESSGPPESSKSSSNTAHVVAFDFMHSFMAMA